MVVSVEVFDLRSFGLAYLDDDYRSWSNEVFVWVFKTFNSPTMVVFAAQAYRF